jgi:hypothetical protein
VRKANKASQREPRPAVGELSLEDAIADLLGEPGDLDAARDRLARRITAYLGPGRIELVITDNRHTMISVRKRSTFRGQVFGLRLHHMFLECQPQIARALGRYVAKNDKAASALLGRYIDANQVMIDRPAAAPRRISPQGEHHDLGAILADLNHRYFGDAVSARITWGRGGPVGHARRRSIKMGSYCPEEMLIRIHPALDHAWVPRFFVQWIVFHEMLHELHEMPVVKGRRQYHTAAFRRDEARFEHHTRAAAWERDNLDRLLRAG